MQLKAKIAILFLVCICTGCASRVPPPFSSVLSVLDLASSAHQFNGKNVEVVGTICDGIETMGLALQPDKKCKKGTVGLLLSFDSGQIRPQVGARVIVAGYFADNSEYDPNFDYESIPGQARLLNYPIDGYLGNYRIKVKSHKQCKNCFVLTTQSR